MTLLPLEFESDSDRLPSSLQQQRQSSLTDSQNHEQQLSCFFVRECV
jgi:hypothetical protein